MVTNIESVEAWEMLKTDKNSQLIDIRTEEEWRLIGIPNLTSINKKVVFLSWQIWPEMEINNSFMQTINKIVEDKEIALLFICRSGGRSSQAANAVQQAGYRNCYNICDGFEGKLSNDRQRSSSNGWKFNNLPWIQD